jgi:RHS repeat-associated protein
MNVFNYLIHKADSYRLGMHKSNLLLVERNNEVEINLAYSSRTLGDKQYELTNHLGNVLAVVTDKKLANNEPDVVSTSDYFPFGMTMPGRSAMSEEYRYGFGSHEKDNEVNSGWYSFGDYGYDARLARRPGPDPMKKEHESVYATFANNPIFLIDPSGRDTVDIYKNDGELKSHKKSKGKDVFRLVDDDGNIAKDDDGNDLIKELPANSLQSSRTQKTTYEKKGVNIDGHVDIYKIRGDSIATVLFKFMVKNTPVEWSQIMTGVEGNKGLNFLTTTREERIEAGAGDLIHGQLYNGYSIRKLIHSHPGNTPYPSGLNDPEKKSGDIGFAKVIGEWYKERYKKQVQPIFQIFTPTDGNYINYNANSEKSDF